MLTRVYTGRGTSRKGAPLLVEELSKHGITVECIDHDEMRTGKEWKKETSTLIIAGQSVRGFKKAMGPDVLQDIQNLVGEGAFDYVGICAGAAFALSHIKYRVIEHPLWTEQKIENTGLSFMYGLATGPSQSVSNLPFSGRTENLHLITVKNMINLKSFDVFHWGGPTIIPLETPRQGRILSCLQSDGTPMSYRLKYGQGDVTLYSFHPEINAENIERWANIHDMEKEVRVAEKARLEQLASKIDGTAFRYFLEETGLKSSSGITLPHPAFMSP